MGISSITSMDSISAVQMATANLKDHKSKTIQNEITNVQQQMQRLSSKGDLSANEKADERKKLQKEISSLTNELKRHQEELRRSQKRERMMAGLRENDKPEKEKAPESMIQSTESSSDTADQKNVSANEQQTPQQGTVIAQNNDGTVILKGTMEQGKDPVTDTEHKQADGPKEESNAEKEQKTVTGDMVTDTELSAKKMHAMVSADSYLQQASRQGTIVTKTKDGMAILKGEIKQDEKRDVNTERKQAALEKMERQEQRAMEFQFNMLGEANNAIKPATEADTSVKDRIQSSIQNNFYISGLNVPPEEQASQQNFYVSVS